MHRLNRPPPGAGKPGNPEQNAIHFSFTSRHRLSSSSSFGLGLSSFNDTAATTTRTATATTIIVPPDPTTTGINLITWGSAHVFASRPRVGKRPPRETSSS
ncbi:MAG TPA: hypothetical protein VM694_30480, partial [Polyangium sp.]|nr:hypothetical protein [Polyangium sp.]